MDGSKPDILLTKVMRHDNEVLDIATSVRNGGLLKHEEGYTWDDVATWDQAIVGRNVTRWRATEAIRKVYGYHGNLPVAGDRVSCMRTNYDLGVMNGDTFVVTVYDAKNAVLYCIDEYGQECEFYVWEEGFNSEGEKYLRLQENLDLKERVWMTFSWAITCHKSQGSEWKDLFIIDEANTFPYADKWRYTAVTRAQESVTAVRPGSLKWGKR
jgi:exodeoxyribonuclease-5